MRRFFRNFAAVFVLALTLPGCLFDPDIQDVVSAIEQEIAPATLRPEATVHVGRGLLTVAKALVSFVPDDDVREARTLLQGIHDIHVGVYVVDGLESGLTIPPDLIDRLANDGWQSVVTVNDEDSTVIVFGQMDGDELGGLYVVIHEDDELIVAKLKGDLSNTIDNAVRQALKGDPDLFEPLHDVVGS